MRINFRQGTALAAQTQGAWEPLASSVVASQQAKLSCRWPSVELITKHKKYDYRPPIPIPIS